MAAILLLAVRTRHKSRSGDFNPLLAKEGWHAPKGKPDRAKPQEKRRGGRSHRNLACERPDRGATLFQRGYSPPCITARRGGRAVKTNIAEHPNIARTGWFSDSARKENHPVCVSFGSSAKFLDDADTPPCCDARRGNAVLSRVC